MNTNIPGLLFDVRALTEFNDRGGAGPGLYAGGTFLTAGGVTVNGIARWDGSAWSPLTSPGGTGVGSGTQFPPQVSALTVFDDGAGPALYLGGTFFTAGGVFVNRIARWDGSEWSALTGPDGIGMSGTVHALTVFDDGTGPALYAGGQFITAGGVTVNRIARWDGSAWSALTGPDGPGVSGLVSALTVFDDGTGPALYAGGAFTTAGGVTVNRIARWNGSSWSALTGPGGTGVGSPVLALTVLDHGTGPELYAGGEFFSAGGLTVRGIARWNGSAWSALTGPGDTGVSGGSVRALTVFDDGGGAGPALYAGGSFTQAGGITASRVAKWTACGDNSPIAPTAIAGGPYDFNATTSLLNLDATASSDPDAIEEGLFNGIFALQWDLGGDGIDAIDKSFTNPSQPVSLNDAAAKGLSVVSSIPLWLTVTDADVLTDTDQTGIIRYTNTPPSAIAGGPYPKVQPGTSLELVGQAIDPDLAQPVAEALFVEWDTTAARDLTEIGDGFATSAAAIVPYDTLLAMSPSKVLTIWLNVGDRSGAIANASVEIELAAADLIASAPAAPSQIVAGSTVQVTWTEQNIGDAQAAGNRVARLYLSTTERFTPGSDLLLASVNLGDPLDAGESVPLSAVVAIPPGISGTRWLIAIVDASNIVPEPFGGEDNNTASMPIQVLLRPTAVAGGPYQFDSALSVITLDGTQSSDPDAVGEGLFNGIVSLQWDLGGDGIDPIDETFTNPTQPVSLSDAVAKGLSVVDAIPLWLTVTDADGLTDTDQSGIVQYLNAPPTAIAGGPYPMVHPGGSITLNGEALDPDLSQPVGEELSVEWDTAVAESISAIGDGFALSPTATVSYEALLAVVPSKVSTIWLNVGDRAASLATASVEIELAAADLIASAPALPSEIVAGSSFDVSWIEENVGDAIAPGTRVARLYLSTDQTFSPSTDLLLASINLPDALAPGASVPINAMVTVPLGTSGPRWFIVVTDATNAVQEPFGGELNNIAITPVEVELEPRADLVVVSSIPVPSSVVAGQAIQLAYSVTNSGQLPATSPWFDAVFLSDDPTIGPADTQLLLTPANAAPLAIGAQYERTVTVPIAPDFIGGTKYLIVRTDNANAILEADETNNTLAIPIEVLPTPGPDLANTTITSAPSSAVFGEPISIAWTAQNIGTETLNSVWSDVVALSTDTTLGAGDILLATTTINVGPLEPNADPYEASLTTTLPLNASVQPGLYYILVRADGGGSITEIDETNNTGFFGPIQIDLPPLPDLVPQNIIAPEQVAIAQSITIELEVANLGGADAEQSFDVLLYAKSPGASGNGTLIGVTTLAGGLPQGQSAPLTLGGIVPEVGGLAVQFTICVDPNNAVLETNTSNNCQTSTLVNILRPNLEPFDIAFPAVVEAGSSVSFQIAIANLGPVPANPSPVWFDGILLSPDDQIGADLPIGSAARVLPVPAGSSYSASVIGVIPESFEGTYWVIAHANRTSTLIESDTTNSLFLRPTPIQIVQPDRPNLVVTAVETPSPGVVGASFEFNWEITNIGPAPASGFWIDRIFASTDPLLGPADIKIGELQFVGTLMPGESIQRTATINYPSLPGEYYFIVQTDSTNTIIEGFDGQENDNTRSSRRQALVENFEAVAIATVIPATEGTPTQIVFNGNAFIEGTTIPAANVPVEIRLANQGFVRKVMAQADQRGIFSAAFTPVPTEAGIYRVSAGPAASPALPISDEFELFGIGVTPRIGPNNTPIVTQVFPGQTIIRNFELRNLGDNTLSGIQAQLSDLPDGVTATIDLPISTLGPLQTVIVPLTISAAPNAAASTPLNIAFTTDQGAAVQSSLAVLVPEPTPNLQPPPASQLQGGKLKAGMLVGQVTYVEFTITNTGGAPTGPIQVQIPVAPWLSVVTQNPLPSVPPGGTAAVTLALSPPENLNLGPYIGSLNVLTAETGFNLPFEFIAISDGIGGILVRATDEFSYYAVPPGETPDPTTPNGPKVAFAEVKVRDLATNEIVALGFTDQDGLIEFSGLEEKFYKVEVKSPNHGNFQSAVKVNNAAVAFVDAFLPRQLVNYVWQVIPTEIADEYLINIQAEFQAFVPAPVVVVEPSLIDLTGAVGPIVQRSITLTNYGLITAEDVRLNLPETIGSWNIIPLVEQIGDLIGGCLPGSESGECTIAVPVLFVRDLVASSTTCDVVSGLVEYNLFCGKNYLFTVGLQIRDLSSCPSSGPVVPGSPPPSSQGGGVGAPTVIPPSQPTIKNINLCVPCASKCGIAIAKCIPGVTCPLNLVLNCVLGFPLPGPSAIVWVQEFKPCLDSLIACKLSPVINAATGGATHIASCICRYLRDCQQGLRLGLHDCTEDPYPCSVKDFVSIGTDYWFDLAFGDEVRGEIDSAEIVAMMLVFPFVVNAYILGDDAWFALEDPIELDRFIAWSGVFSAATSAGSSSGVLIDREELDQVLQAVRPSNILDSQVLGAVERWNLTVSYYAGGVFNIADVPLGQAVDFIEYSALTSLYQAYADAGLYLEYVGLSNLDQAEVYYEELANEAYQDSLLIGTCATVKIQIDQALTLTRSAFEASLVVENQSDISLDGVTVNLFIRGAGGVNANDLFAGSNTPVLSGISAIDGTASIPAGASASTTWTLIPFDEAAPQVTTSYLVSGNLSYFFGGSLVEVPLFPVPISVIPNPALELKYFLETLIFSDDPFTPEIEPAVPFSLGLLIANTGAGPANNLTIESSQPKVIENNLGLVIDFDIIGTRLNLSPIAPSLKVNFGNLPGGDTATAQWIMISSLQGEFISYSAEFKHVSPFAQPELSLIKSVDIFGLTRVVFDDEPRGFDAQGNPIPPIQKPAFLTNDFPDIEDLADTVHLPDNTTAPVTVIQSATVTTDIANLQATITVNMPDGYTYIRLDDPYNAAFPLKSVQRADGKPINTQYNAWQTSRIIRKLGEPERTERLIHLFDRNGPGQYILSFDPDGQPPQVDRVLAVADHTLAGLEQLALDLDAIGLVSEPRADVQRVIIIFNEPINPDSFNKASVFIEGLTVGDVPVAVPSYTVELRSGDLVGVIDFDAPLPDVARYCIKLVGVTDLAGNLLAGDSALQRFSVLLADATGDQRVNNTDVGGVLSLVGTDPIDPNNPFHVRSDINRDGRIDMADVQIVLAQRGNGTGSIANPCIVIEGPPSEGGKDEPGIPPALADRPLTPTGRPNDIAAFEPAPHIPGQRPLRRPQTPVDALADQNAAPNNIGRTPGAEPGEPIALIDAEGNPLVIDGHWIAFRAVDRRERHMPGMLETQDLAGVVDGDGHGAGDAIAEPIDPAALLSAYGFDTDRLIAAEVEGWLLAPLPMTMRDAPSRSGLAGTLLPLGGYLSPLLINADTGDLVAVETSITIATLPGIPATWMDRVLATILPEAAQITPMPADSDDGTLTYLITLNTTAEGVLTLADTLAQRRELASVRPTFIGPMLTIRTLPPTHPADLNRDGRIDDADLQLLLQSFGTSDPAADLNGDGIVDNKDLEMMLEAVRG